MSAMSIPAVETAAEAEASSFPQQMKLELHHLCDYNGFASSFNYDIFIAFSTSDGVLFRSFTLSQRLRHG